MTFASILGPDGAGRGALEALLLAERPGALGDAADPGSSERALVVLVPLPPRLDGDADGDAALALAHYERDLRHAAAAARGSRTLVVPVDPVDPKPSVSAIAQYLDGTPVTPAPGVAVGDDPAAPASVAALARHLIGLSGEHESFDPGELSAESLVTRALLGLEDDLEQVSAALVWASEQIDTALDAASPRRRGVSRGNDDDDDQFEEPGINRPYRLDASEDTPAFHRWLAERREPLKLAGVNDHIALRARSGATRVPPLVSVVVPVYKPPRWALEEAIASVLDQSDAGFEIVLCDDGSGDADLTRFLDGLARRDRRIKTTALSSNGGLSAATNAALELATGEFVAFLDHDDLLAPDAVAAVRRHVELTPDADVLYSDQDKVDQEGVRYDPLFKPEWSPELLLSFAYVAHLLVVRRSLVVELGGLRSEFDGSQDYDLALRATERARRVVHIPELLYHWRALPASTASGAGAKPWAFEAGERVVAEAMRRRNEPAEVTSDARFPGRYHVRRAIVGHPTVSVIMPFRDQPELVAACLRSLRRTAGYDNVEFLLVDNESELPETAALLDRLARDQDVRVIPAPGPFNFPAINNAAARAAGGDVLLFANNDMEAHVDGWLHAMLGHVQRPDVGVVGARLLYPDGTIQHTGVVIGLGGIAGHVLRGLPGERPGYNSLAISTRECSVVTAACMMLRREVFEEIGGFDELLPVAFNDVDLCLKARAAGYRVVFTPLAELIHFESRSRGHTDDTFEEQRFRTRWAAQLHAGDPYHNVHLSHWRYWCPLSTPQEDYRWQTYLERAAPTPASSPSA